MYRPRVIATVLIASVMAAAVPKTALSGDDVSRFVIISSKANKPPPLPSKPYQPVIVQLPKVFDEADFENFRAQFAAAVNARIYAELARLVARQGFFWDRDFHGSFDHQQPGVDNLAAAVRLERRNGSGWALLAKFAAETTATPLVGRPGVVCAPGNPTYDEVEFGRVIDATASTAPEWSYPHAEKTAVRTAPQASAAVIDTIGPVLLHVLNDSANDMNSENVRRGWARVATPAGRIGFIAPGALASLSPARLCYGKDGFGRWHITGFISGD